MQQSSHRFRDNAARALRDTVLQDAMNKARGGFVEKRRIAVENLPEFSDIKEHGMAVRNHSLARLADYLEMFESRLLARGGKVHWAADPAEACRVVTELCRQRQARSIAKGKSMIGEEINLNEALQAAGFEVVETDLGEYIIQLADEPPSHIIAPAVHKTRQQIVDLFRKFHAALGYTGPLESVSDIVNEARAVLREKFLQADVGITGANFLIAESGSTMIVTNEGNGDLSAVLPDCHIVLASIEKVVPTLEDCSSLLRLLARSATGQECTTYTTFFTGPKPRPDGSQSEFHVVLIDNGRSDMLFSDYRDMLRCIKCGTCMYHCPVYSSIGGHAYGWVYPGPMGSVLTPLMTGLQGSLDLPNASTFCGRCAEVCPMGIPLPDLLRRHRQQAYTRHLFPRTQRWGLGIWAFLAARPGLYRLASGLAGALGGLLSRRGLMPRLPGLGNWQSGRELPAPAARSFMRQWQAGQGKSGGE